MLTLLSTLISFLMGGLPKLLDFFQDRSDKRHEMELAQLQVQREMELRKLGFEAQERVEHVKTEQLEIETKSAEKQSLIAAQTAEMQAVYAHDTALNEGTSQWMKNLRASVRPVITYGFFFLLVGIAHRTQQLFDSLRLVIASDFVFSKLFRFLQYFI